MGNNPDDSVTNAYNQTWDVPNLLVVDGSSLPTGAAVNPSSTIGPIAVRCAEFIGHRAPDEDTREQQGLLVITGCGAAVRPRGDANGLVS